MNSSIPVYRSDGRLHERVTERQLSRMESVGLIARVVRHRKGHINRAILFARPDDLRPTQPVAHMGTRYSFKEHLAHGFCWDLKRLDGSRDGKTYAPDDTRGLFLAVVNECIVA